jgi:hypothetical protein
MRKFRVLMFLATLLAAVVPSLQAGAGQFVWIANRATGAYLHNDSGVPKSGRVEPGWSGAMWIVEPAPNPAFVRLRNRWANGYLNIETDVRGGTPQVTDLPPNDATGWWSLERIEGTPFVRIRNVWTNAWLNTERGGPAVTSVPPGCRSAVWRIMPVRPGPLPQIGADDPAASGSSRRNDKSGR